MKKIEVSELTENFFETISKEWILVCAGDANQYNMMTASWGGIGWLWNKPVAFVFIRPERYTFEFTENNDFMTLSFLGKSPKAREVYNLCGSKSGRDIDKTLESGLTPYPLEDGKCVTFEQARLAWPAGSCMPTIWLPKLSSTRRSTKDGTVNKAVITKCIL